MQQLPVKAVVGTADVHLHHAGGIEGGQPDRRVHLDPAAYSVAGLSVSPWPMGTWSLRCLMTLSPLLLLAACNSSEEVDSTSGSRPSPVPLLTNDPEPLQNIGSIPLAAADGSPLAAGVWQIGENDTVASASFVSPQGRGLLSITCEMATKVISLAVANDLPGNQTFVLQSGGTAARLDTIPDSNFADPHQTAAIAPQTPVFEGFVHPGGTIQVSQPGGMTLRLPSNSGIRRVFQVCQS
jgi:hypothetical protein